MYSCKNNTFMASCTTQLIQGDLAREKTQKKGDKPKKKVKQSTKVTQ